MGGGNIKLHGSLPQCFWQTGRNNLYFNLLPQTSRNQLLEVTQAINQWKSSQKCVLLNTEETIEDDRGTKYQKTPAIEKEVQKS